MKVLLLVLLVQLANSERDDSLEGLYDVENSNGFEGEYRWEPSVEGALRQSGLTRKPAMVIIHRKWCEMSKQLRQVFLKSKKIQCLGRQFLMVNSYKDGELDKYKKAFFPDGDYFPRIIFIKNGNVAMNKIQNPDSSFRHYFITEQQVLKAMRAALGGAYGKTYQINEKCDNADE